MKSLTGPETGHRDGSAGLSEQTRLSIDDQQALARAMRELEQTSLAVRLSSLLGQRAGVIGTILPEPVAAVANRAAVLAVRNGLDFALRSLAGKPLKDRRRMHKSLAVFAGAAGGAFGLSSLPVELPVTTTILLRSIADIGRSEGQDLTDPRAALSCLEVFAYGGRAGMNRVIAVASGRDEEMDLHKGSAVGASYFAIRALLAKSISEAANLLAGRGITRAAAPVMVRLAGQIGSRFGTAVAQKLAAQSIPILGAAGGAAINYAFADHFETIARGHFTILRLERRYGAPIIRAEVERMQKSI